MASDSKKASNAAEIDRLALVFAKEPGSKVFIPLAEEYGKAGMWEEAAAVLEDGLKAYPSFITAMVALGRAYEQMNQPVKAKAILEEAIKLSPDNLRAHRTLAKLYTVEGAKDAAIRSCNVILAMNPHDQEALSLRAGLGVTAIRTGDEAREPFQEKEVGVVKPSRTSSAHSEAEAVPTSTIPASTSENRRRAQVVQLEQWLSLIQARRCGPQESSRVTS
jgi:tetratricopeptide (TPR) repeat protein